MEVVIFNFLINSNLQISYTMSKTKTNAKWDDDAHLKFIELCELEIRKGNRPNTHLSRDGWKNTIKAFYEKTGRRYKKKQMKNHWDGMKAEWTLFKQLMRGDTGIGWDATKNTIMADDDWWKRKIKVHFSHCSICLCYFFHC